MVTLKNRGTTSDMNRSLSCTINARPCGCHETTSDRPEVESVHSASIPYSFAGNKPVTERDEIRLDVMGVGDGATLRSFIVDGEEQSMVLNFR